jgi:hypothetical protein
VCESIKNLHTHAGIKATNVREEALREKVQAESPLTIRECKYQIIRTGVEKSILPSLRAGRMECSGARISSLSQIEDNKIKYMLSDSHSCLLHNMHILPVRLRPAALHELLLSHCTLFLFFLSPSLAAMSLHMEVRRRWPSRCYNDEHTRTDIGRDTESERWATKRQTPLIACFFV